MEKLGGQLGAGASQRVAEGDRAAIGIDISGRQPVLDSDSADGVEGLRGKGLIDFEHIDILGCQPCHLQDLGYRIGRTDAHFFCLAAGHRKIGKSRERLYTNDLRLFHGHQQAEGGAIRHLGGVGGGDATALLEGGLQLRHVL